jgi:hypothetical protein
MPDAGRLLALAEEHKRGLHLHDARADCSRCVMEPLLSPEEGLDLSPEPTPSEAT